MPYKKAYTQKTVGKGGSMTPTSVMGGQGSSVKVKPMYNKTKPTKMKKFPQ